MSKHSSAEESRPKKHPQKDMLVQETSQPSEQINSEEPVLEITGSRQLTSWMVELRVSFIFTTYQAGKVFLVGIRPDGRLSIFERTFNRCMGVCGNSQTFYMSSLYQIWRFDNVLEPGQINNGYDRLYVPQMAYTTGDIDVHDMALDENGQLFFINSLFSCLATVSESHSFKVAWQPKFITKLLKLLSAELCIFPTISTVD